jgi:hypothetical protein
MVVFLCLVLVYGFDFLNIDCDEICTGLKLNYDTQQIKIDYVMMVPHLPTHLLKQQNLSHQ